MHRYGETRVEEGAIRYTPGTTCGAIPHCAWQIPLDELRVMAELTTPGGPVFDYFYLFFAGRPARIYMVPMESLEPVGLSAFFGSLARPLHHALAASTTYASSVMWPPEHAGKELFDFVTVRKGTNWLARLFTPSITPFVPNQEAAMTLGDAPVWAA